MRMRISTKLFLVLLFTIALFAALMYLFSALFLEKFYIHSKERQLYATLDTVKNILAQDSEDYEDSFSALQFQRGINLIVADSEYNDVFSTAPFRSNQRSEAGSQSHVKNPVSERMIQDNESKFTEQGTIVRRPIREIDQPDDGRQRVHTPTNLSANDNPDPQKADMQPPQGQPPAEALPDWQANVESLSLFASVPAKSGATYYAIISTSFEAMKSSVEAAAVFIQYVALAVFVVGALVLFFISRRVTKPLVKINEVAGNMAKLDLSHVIENKANDEIGDIGRSINTLSFALRKTLGELSDTNARLREQLDQRERIDESRKQFISDVSHELKTPIALIGGYAEGLKLNVNNEDKEYYCDVIIDETNRMGALVRSLLDLSQIEGGYARMTRETYSMREQLQGILRRYRSLFADKGITVEFDETQDCMIEADSVRIEQVVTNFINNAIDHLDAKKQIALSIERRGDRCRVTVQNTGKHIPAGQLDKIWDSFYKLDQSRKRSGGGGQGQEFGGTGLGLAIVKAIVTAHGGDCGVDNVPGGVAFWFEI